MKRMLNIVFPILMSILILIPLRASCQSPEAELEPGTEGRPGTCKTLRTELVILQDKIGSATKNLQDYLTIDVQGMNLAAAGQIDLVIASISVYAELFQPGGDVERQCAALLDKGQTMLRKFQQKLPLNPDYQGLILEVSDSYDKAKQIWGSILGVRDEFARNIEELKTKRTFIADCVEAEMYVKAVAKADEVKRNLMDLNNQVKKVLSLTLTFDQAAAAN